MVAPKEEKRWHAKEAWPKKKERKRGNHVPKIRQGMIRERKPLPQGVRHIYPSTHTLAPFDRDCMTCFSIDPLFVFTIYGIQVCPVLILPWAPQKLCSSRKDWRQQKLSASRESSWELCHTFKNSSIISRGGLQIYEQVSITLCTILTLNSPRRGDS